MRASVRTSVFHRCTAGEFLEQAAEMLGVLETELVGYLADSLVAAEHLVFGQTDDLVLDMFLGCLPGFLFYQVPEIVRGKADLVCKVLYCREALRFR